MRALQPLLCSFLRGFPGAKARSSSERLAGIPSAPGPGPGCHSEMAVGDLWSIKHMLSLSLSLSPSLSLFSLCYLCGLPWWMRGRAPIHAGLPMLGFPGAPMHARELRETARLPAGGCRDGPGARDPDT